MVECLQLHKVEDLLAARYGLFTSDILFTTLGNGTEMGYD